MIDLRAIRRRWKWSQKTLAAELGVCPRTLQRWERSGRIPEPAHKLLGRLLDDPLKRKN